MIQGPQVFYSPDGGGGDGGADPGAQTTAPEWHGQSEFIKSNPDAAKTFAKYKTTDDALKAGHEAIKLVAGTPYRLPKDFSKLSEDQKTEIRAFYHKAHGVPETVEGYNLKIPDDIPIHQPTLEKYVAQCLKAGKTIEDAQADLDLQADMVRTLNKERLKVIEGMTHNNFKTFLNEDCGGDKELADSRMKLVNQLLQTQFTKDGKIDTEGWEKFKARLYHDDRIIELPILRALHEAAQMKLGTGGAPGGFGMDPMSRGGLYSEMRKK